MEKQPIFIERKQYVPRFKDVCEVLDMLNTSRYECNMTPLDAIHAMQSFMDEDGDVQDQHIIFREVGFGEDTRASTYSTLGKRLDKDGFMRWLDVEVHHRL